MRIFLPIVFLLFIAFSSFAQDIPLLGQKLSNSLIYNPAVAGNSLGSFTYSYRKNYNNVNGAPESHLLSLQTPFSNYRFGVGGTVYQEDVNFLRTTYVSGAFAYHMHFNKFTILSMGVSGEYDNMGIRGSGSNSPNALNDPAYMSVLQGKINNYDFSFGMHFQNPWIKIGLAANRLESGWLKKEKNSILTSFYSGTAQGIIHTRGGEDLFEPYLAYRKFSSTNNTLDAGLYYTFSAKILLGAAVRSKIGAESGNRILSATLGYYVTKNMLLGYSHESMLGAIGGYVGASNEFTLRIDFNNRAYRESFRDDYKSAVSYRRKIVTRAGVRNPQQLKKKMKKLKPFTPNTRYQSVRKPSGNKKNNSQRQSH